MEEQILEIRLNMPLHDLTAYEEEETLTYISIPIYQVYTVIPIVYVDTRASDSCMVNKNFERTVNHS